MNFNNPQALTPQQVDSWRSYLQSKTLIQEKKKKPVIAYAGTSGSFSEDATIKYFGKDSFRIACKNFIDIFKNVSSGSSDYGVIPIENTTTGSVKDIFELLDQYDCFIVGETQVYVDQYLLGIPGSTLEDITDVYSHEQSLMQCSDYLEEHSQWELHPYSNNALAAKFVSNEKNKNFGVIAGKRAGQIHNLIVLEKHINFLENNTTRFIIIANHPEKDEANKTSLSFSVDHKPGALVKVLNIFDKYQLNLCKIESRPSRRKNWEYKFFIDIEGKNQESVLDKAIQEVIANTIEFNYLGSYHSNLK